MAVKVVRVRFEVDQSDLKQADATIKQINEDLKRADTTAKKVDFKPVSQGINQASGNVGILQAGLTRLIPVVAAAFSVQKILDFGRSALQLAGEIETVRASLTTLTGSQREANALMNQTIALAARTPYEFPELAGTVKQLLAFNIQQGKVIDLTSRLGDIASGTGGDLKGLAFVFGQVNAQGRAMTQDLNQFASRGIPIYEELGKVFGVTAGEVRKLAEQGKVGFNEIEQAVVNLTSEGGKFFGMMEAQSQTFEGKLSTFNDAWKGLVRTLGNELLPVAKDVLTWLTEIIDTTGKYSDSLREEQAELNTLARGYINALQVYDDSAEAKKNLDYWTKQLNREYPELLANLGDEATNIEAVRDRLTELNQQYINRIKLASADELIAENSKKSADAFKQQIEAQRLLTQSVTEFNKKRREQGLSEVDQTRNLASQVDQMKELIGFTEALTDELGANAKAFADFDDWTTLINPLSGAFFRVARSAATADTEIGNVLKAQEMYEAAGRDMAEGDKLVTEIMAAKEKQLRDLGLTEEQVMGTSEKHSEVQQQQIGIIEALKGQIKALNDEREKATSAERIGEIDRELAALERQLAVYDRTAKQAKIVADSIGDYRKQIGELEKQITQATDSGTIKKLEGDIAALNAEINKLLRGSLSEITLPEIETMDPAPLVEGLGATREAIDELGKDGVNIFQKIGGAISEDQRKLEAWTKGLEIAGEALSALSALYGAFAGLIDATRTRQEEEEIARIESEKEKFIENAKDKNKARLQAEKTYDQQIKAIEIEQAKRRKKIAITEAIIASALNVVKALGTPPVPNFIAAGIAAALGAAQVATISQQGFKKGGFTGDGRPSDVAGPVHKGEFVFPADMTRANRKEFEWMLRNRINLGDLLRDITPQVVPVNVGSDSRRTERLLGKLVNIAERGQRQQRREYMEARDTTSARNGW